MKYTINKDGSVAITENDYYKIHKDYRGTMNIMGIPVPTMLIKRRYTSYRIQNCKVYGLVMHPILFIKLLILVSIPIAVIVMGLFF